MPIDPSTLSWWNLLPQRIDPTIFTVFGIPLRWYGVGYLLAFWTVWVVMKRTLRAEKDTFSEEQLERIFLWTIVGLLIGARLGYALFYNAGFFLAHPLQIVYPTTNGHFAGIAGMSFHGGVIGAAVGSILCGRVHKIDWRKYYSYLCYAIPLGYTWGRLGNFMNGELYGRPTDSPIGMLFPADRSQLLRHPSQLYEAFGEGLLVFGIMTLLRRKVPATKILMGPLFVGLYGVVRFFVEFFREPDAHIGLGWMNLSRGQFLCVCMMVAALLWGAAEIRRDRRLRAAAGK